MVITLSYKIKHGYNDKNKMLLNRPGKQDKLHIQNQEIKDGAYSCYCAYVLRLIIGFPMGGAY